MDEARAVIERLERIEALGGRRDTPPETLLAELRLLVDEAERWARRERDDAAVAAAARCRLAVEDGEANLNPVSTISLLG